MLSKRENEVEPSGTPAVADSVPDSLRTKGSGHTPISAQEGEARLAAENGGLEHIGRHEKI